MGERRGHGLPLLPVSAPVIRWSCCLWPERAHLCRHGAWEHARREPPPPPATHKRLSVESARVGVPASELARTVIETADLRVAADVLQVTR